MVARQQDKDTTTTRVYKYGLVPIDAFPKEAIYELKRANQLWNRLVALHHNHFEELEQARCNADSAYAQEKTKLAEVETKIEQAKADKRKARIIAQTRNKDEPAISDVNQQIKDLEQQRRDIFETLKPLRKKADKFTDKAALESAFENRVNCEVRVTNSGLGSNTANAIKDYFKTARNRIFKTGGKLRFHRFDGTGFFTFRFKPNGATTKYGESFDGLFQGNKPNDRRFAFIGRDDSRKKPRLRLRATLAGGRRKDSKTRVAFDVIYHRPVPENAILKDGKILRCRVGDRFTYHLVLTVQTPAINPPTTKHTTAVGIDIGFRQENNRIRVATVATNEPDGPTWHIYLPEKMVTAFEHVNALKAELDDAATNLGTETKSIIAGTPLDKSHKRYCLWRAIAKYPINGTLSFETAYRVARWLFHEPDFLPEDAASKVRVWWRTYSRRYRELNNLRAKQLRNRQHCYRHIGAELVAKGHPIAVVDIDLSKWAEVKDADNPLSDQVRARRFLAALSELRDAIENAAVRELIPFVKVPAEYTSKTYFTCKKINYQLTGDQVYWDCPNCATKRHRDVNAARNIAQKGIEALENS